MVNIPKKFIEKISYYSTNDCLALRNKSKSHNIQKGEKPHLKATVTKTSE
jgi:hypothetical protein